MIQNPKTDPIIEEIHRVRRAISDRFGGDVHAIAADANARMAASGCPIWKPSDNKPIHGSGEVNPGQMETQSSPPPDAGRSS